MAKTPQQRRSRLQERRIAEEIGGREQPASGAAWNAKGDVRKLGELRVEAKYTEKNYYVLKLADLLKIRDEALLGGAEQWAFQVEFTSFYQKWALLDFGLWHHMFMFQADAEDVVNLSEYFAPGKSIRLHAHGLYQKRTASSSKKQAFVARVIFQSDEPNAEKFTFALIDWDEFIHLRETFYP
jgi:hypothetical protein